MTSTKKYIGMDVHKESISIAVMNAAGKIVMECRREDRDGMRHRDQGEHDPAVHRRAAGRFARDP
jgi:hypothetical protein